MKPTVTIFVVITFICGISFSEAILTEDQKLRRDQYALSCMEKTGINVVEAARILTGDFRNKNDDLQCFINCLLEKARFIKNGVIQEANILNELTKSGNKNEHIRELLKNCKRIAGKNNCEKAFKLYQCYVEHMGTLTEFS